MTTATMTRSPVFRSFRQLAQGLASAGRVAELEAQVKVMEEDREKLREEMEEWKCKARTCVFCNKVCNSLLDLRRHVLWCKGTTP